MFGRFVCSFVVCFSVARGPPLTPLPGSVYYLNTETDEALWERPAGFVEAAVDDSEAAAPAVPGLDLKFAAAA